MVAADIDTSSAAVSSSMTSSPKWRSTATNSASIGASRLPAGIPSTGPADRQRRNDISARTSAAADCRGVTNRGLQRQH